MAEDDLERANRNRVQLDCKSDFCVLEKHSRVTMAFNNGMYQNTYKQNK